MARSRADTQAETRRRLLDAAYVEFTTRRFGSVSLDDVATRAGFTKGAVYSNFDSKTDLLFSVLEDYFADIGSHYVNAVVDGEVDDIGAGVGGRAGRTQDDNTGFFRLLTAVWSEAMHDDVFAERFLQIRSAHRTRIAEAILERGASVDIDLSDISDDLAVGIIAMSMGTLLEASIDHAVDADQVHRVVVDSIVAGLLATRLPHD